MKAPKSVSVISGLMTDDNPILVNNQKSALAVLADYAKKQGIDRDEVVMLIEMLGLDRHVTEELLHPA